MLRALHLSSLFALTLALNACVVTDSNDDETHDESGEQDGRGGKGGDDGNDSDGENPDEGELGPASRFFLPTGEQVTNTTAPKIEIDEEGGIHAVYPAYAGGGAYYAYCPSNCQSEDDVSVVRFETQGTVANAMLALDSNGKPRVLLSAYAKVHYASCDDDCSSPGSWKTAEILDHGSEREVSGNAFALDPQGRPRFLMHTYVAYLGIGQKPPRTDWLSCDSNCHEPSSWKASTIATDIFRSSELRFDAEGRAHLATVALLGVEEGDTSEVGAYLLCEEDCANPDSWSGPSFGDAHSSEYEAVPMKPSISLSLTRAGQPRVLFMGRGNGGAAMLVYFDCDADCREANSWSGMVLSDHEELGEGIDLALDENDKPRVVYTLDDNIGLLHCDTESCTSIDATWDLAVVEKGSDMPSDDIFLYPNCTVGAWLLHSPSIALTPSGRPRVGYQARDISGGWTTTDPSKPPCTAGTDMSLSRLAIMERL